MSRGCISMGQRDLLQDCGKPWYVEDYNSFYTAIKKLYPNITLIANCNMGGDAPTDLWDWHSYDESFTMFVPPPPPGPAPPRQSTPPLYLGTLWTS